MNKQATERLAESALREYKPRFRLTVRGKPYWYIIQPGLAIGYRRRDGAGTWVARSTAKGNCWEIGLGTADDDGQERVEANGVGVLTYKQARDAAVAEWNKRRGEPVAGQEPVTVGEAIEAYRQDLVARQKNPRNAEAALAAVREVAAYMLTKPVGRLDKKELRTLRNNLQNGKRGPASVNRIIMGLKAALTGAANGDAGITNGAAWTGKGNGLEPFPDAFASRNVVVGDEDGFIDDGALRRLIAASYAKDPALGLLVNLAAMTGTRFSQLIRIEVRGLRRGRDGATKIVIPPDRKGRSKTLRPAVAFPLEPELARKLWAAAAGRAPDAPLLLNRRGLQWEPGEQRIFHRMLRQAGFDSKITINALRHTKISRLIEKKVPTEFIAKMTHTSARMIERTYAALIAEHSNAFARELSELDPPKPPVKLVA
jgi:hypothetical protein